MAGSIKITPHQVTSYKQTEMFAFFTVYMRLKFISSNVTTSEFENRHKTNLENEYSSIHKYTEKMV